MSDRPYMHLHPDARHHVESSPADRILFIRRPRWVEYPAATRVQARIRDVYEQPSSDRMENLLITAESGVGKTRLLRKTRNILALTSTSGAECHPVVSVIMPSNPTEKDLLFKIQRYFRTHKVGLSHLEVSYRQLDVCDLFRKFGTKILMIDEINSLHAGTPRQQRVFLQVLRSLSNEGGVALVCAGIPEAMTAFRTDRQLYDRFSYTTLPLWTAGDDLQQFIGHVVGSMPLRLPSVLGSAKLCQLLADRSGGVTFHMCRAIERAAIAAVESGREMIDLDGLQEESVWKGSSYEERRLGLKGRWGTY